MANIQKGYEWRQLCLRIHRTDWVELSLLSKSRHPEENERRGNSTYDAAGIDILEKVGGKVYSGIADG